MILKIATLNCQNNQDNRDNRNNRASLLALHILKKKYDILGTQELTMKFTKRLDSYLREYDFYGDYQYGRGIIGTRFPLIKSFNQGNQIVTYLPVSSTSTRALPWLRYTLKEFIRALKKGAIARRIMTKVEIELPKERVTIVNTHLDYYTPSLQKRQLAFLLKKIKKYSRYSSIVLMGDFNLETTNPIFASFIRELENYQLVRVPVEDKTNASKYRQKNAIDHIFLPRSWQVLGSGVISTKELSDLTDHKAVYAVVSTN